MAAWPARKQRAGVAGALWRSLPSAIWLAKAAGCESAKMKVSVGGSSWRIINGVKQWRRRSGRGVRL